MFFLVDEDWWVAMNTDGVDDGVYDDKQLEFDSQREIKLKIKKKLQLLLLNYENIFISIFLIFWGFLYLFIILWGLCHNDENPGWLRLDIDTT